MPTNHTIQQLVSRVLTLLVGVTLALALSGCASATPVNKSERGRNIEACNQMAELYMQLYADADNGNIGDPDARVDAFLAAWTQIGIDADSPMGDWMVENAALARAEYESGETAETEERGEALANGESVEADEGSLQHRCQNLGVTIP